MGSSLKKKTFFFPALLFRSLPPPPTYPPKVPFIWLRIEGEAGGGWGEGQLHEGGGNVDGVHGDGHGLAPAQLHLEPVYVLTCVIFRSFLGHC